MIITILGWFCAVMLCIAIACFAIALAADLVRRSFERFEWAIHSKSQCELGRSLYSSAHWFSESKEAYEVIRILADNLIKGYGIDPNLCREEWRRRLKTVPESEKNL